jgi:sialidase-1
MNIDHIVVHRGNGDYHAAFPDVIRLTNGDLVAAFREARPRPGTGEAGTPGETLTHHHMDPDSRISLVRSTDEGATWDPDTHVVIDASDGTEDINMPALAQLSSGELIVNNARWFVGRTDLEVEALGENRWARPRGDVETPYERAISGSVYFHRSSDMGWTWGEPEPVDISALAYSTHVGKMGAIDMPDGSLLAPFDGWTAADARQMGPDRSMGSRFFVARSSDGGRTWGQPSTVAQDIDGRVDFWEPAMIRLPDGKLLAVVRTGGADGYFYQAFSTDDGWTWEGVRRTPIWGQPAQLLRLRSGRILCSYGYRQEPFGVRAVFSEDEGETWDMDNEIVIREDGLHRDLGYPASVQLQDDRILTVYYFHGADGIRYIGGSIYAEDYRG